MAIDDNTTYGLTGAQVKDLAQRIQSSGGGDGIVELTAADYDYPTANPTGIAIWLLPTGIYKTKDGVSLFYGANASGGTQASLIVVHHENQYPSAVVYNWGTVQGEKTGGLSLGYSDGGGSLSATVYNKIVTADSLRQSAGNSTAYAMSQNATTSMVFNDPSTRRQVKIGNGAISNSTNTVAVGGSATANNTLAMALGSGTTANGERSVAIGVGATTGNNFASIALGAQSLATRQGELNIGTGTTSYGYNNTSYRVIGGVHDPVDDHDAATKGYVDTAVAGAGGGLITLSYGISTWQDFIDAYNDGKIVYCRASSNSNPATGDQTRMAFMAYVNNSSTPTEVEFQYVRSVSTKSASNQSDQVFVYKLTSANGGTWTVETRPVMVKISAGTNMTSSYSNNTLTLDATQPTVNDSTVTVTNNGTTKGSFTTNQSAAGTVALDYPEITMTTTDPGEGVALAANHFIGVYE